MRIIDINCDLGEGMPNDAAIMPYISSANIACGYHAGDEVTIRKTIELCMHHHIAIGAHPGFQDRQHFGRKEHNLTFWQYYDVVIEQLHILKKVTDSTGTFIHHVKPHGALYNMAASREEIALAIVSAVKDFNKDLILYGLSGSQLISTGNAAQLKTASEGFADRRYRNDGTLVPRTASGAVINDFDAITQQVLQMTRTQTVTTADNKIIPIVVETICIHGDEPNAADVARRIHEILNAHKIVIRSK